MTVPAPHVSTPWLEALPPQYLDRVRFDAWSGMPSFLDVDAGNYQVARALTNADRRACGIPPLSPGR